MARILIIDDEDLVLDTLHQILEMAGHEVMEAVDGEQGLERYRNDPTDLVITDIIMPRADGIETIMTLKREYPNVKIIAMSGGGRINQENLLGWAASLGVQHIVHKPFDSKKIVEIVRQAVVENMS